MTTYRVALCGLSPIAARRPENTLFGRAVGSHAAAYASHPNCQVVAVCDLRHDLVVSFQESWADIWNSVAGYTEFSLLLADTVPDILSVVTPDDRHADIVVAAAQAGVKGILCEKPLATNLADADRMIAAVEAAGVPMVVNHTRRFMPLFHLVRDAIHLGEIGDLLYVGCYFAGPRAMLFRNGTHLIDMLCFLADSRPTTVSGQLEDGFDHWDRYRGDGGHDPNSEPTATARIEFANGVVGTYESLRARETDLYFDVGGSAGHIRIHDRYAELSAGGKTRILVPEPFDGVGITAAVSELLRLMRYDGSGVSTPADARATLEVLLAILASHQAGGAPIALPLPSG